MREDDPDRAGWMPLPSEEYQRANPDWNRKATVDEGQPPGDLQVVKLPPIPLASLPPRAWAYGRFLLFGSASVIGAVDGGGKGAIAAAMSAAFVTGLSLLGEKVWRKGPVAIVTYEDDLEEWHRRIGAVCEHYRLDYDSVLAGIHFLTLPGRAICFADLANGRPVFPDGDAVIAALRAIGAVLLIVDPFNHAHGFDDGNNNVMVARVAREMSRIARESGAAVLVLHHLRKGSNGASDDLMGATSLRATFRSARILARMAPETAKNFSITEPWRYIRIAGTKENYAPPPGEGTWFKLESVGLGNAIGGYPFGDEVAVATRWHPRPMFQGLDAASLRAVFDALRRTTHSPAKQARKTPWAGRPLMELGGRSDKEASTIVSEWLGNGVLVTETVWDNRNDVQKVTVVEAKAAEILAGIEGINAPSD